MTINDNLQNERTTFDNIVSKLSTGNFNHEEGQVLLVKLKETFGRAYGYAQAIVSLNENKTFQEFHSYDTND